MVTPSTAEKPILIREFGGHYVFRIERSSVSIERNKVLSLRLGAVARSEDCMALSVLVWHNSCEAPDTTKTTRFPASWWLI